MLSGPFILRRLQAGKRALNCLVWRCRRPSLTSSPCSYREGLSLVCRGSLSVCWFLSFCLLRKGTWKGFCVLFCLSKTVSKDACPLSQILEGCFHHTDIWLIALSVTSRPLLIGMVYRLWKAARADKCFLIRYPRSSTVVFLALVRPFGLVSF